MSWLLNLYETYQLNQEQVGKIEKKHNDQEFTLLPISHTTQNAQIEVLVTEEGAFHSAFVVDKNDASTLIPCTEDAASRAGDKNAPYPLHDKLSYVAGDFIRYGGNPKKKDHYDSYIANLRAWSESPYAVPRVKSIYRYLSQGTLIRDLVAERVLHLDADRKLIVKWDAQYESLVGTKPPIFTVVNGEQESAFVRFTVYSSDAEKVSKKVWNDPEMYQSFIRFYNEQLGDSDLCYVSGQLAPATDKHANKIRNAADKAKLISANDSSGFTFRGRFLSGQEAACISYEVSQKAHNALKWLINRQGKNIDGRVFLVWGNAEPDMIGVTEDLFDILPGSFDKSETPAFTNQDSAVEVARAIDGYRNRVDSISRSASNVNIMILDSATTGRMAVLYYRNLDKQLYLDRLVHWHTTCSWLHRYHKNDRGEYVPFRGAPATKDIALAAYGSKASDKVVKGVMERMLPCIIDGRNIPQDIVSRAVRRASNPAGMDRWEWEKTLSITCALVNKQKEGFDVALDHQNDDRSYLFGRLMAVADVLERRALGSEETRATNAIRYMSVFSRHPARTWNTIQQGLQPYLARLGLKATYWTKIIDEVASRIPADQFNNRPLTELYLLGFYSQRHELYQKKDANAGHAAETEGNATAE